MSQVNGAHIVGMVGAIFVIAIIVGLLMALPVMWCWNYLMPELFGLPKIGFLQALVMNILSSLLFKSGTSTSSK